MIDIESLTESGLSLFLSVDVGGSTALKNRLNHSTLWNSYQERKQLLMAMSSPSEADEEKAAPGEQAAGNNSGQEDAPGSVRLEGFLLNDDPKCILTVFQDWTIENYDWAAVIAHRLSYFHGEFLRVLETKEPEHVNVSEGIDRYLWKAVGDELIYVFEIQSFAQLHVLVTSFLTVLREFDRKEVERQDRLRSRSAIRFKGSAWVAGFPVRNRRVKFRGPDLYTMVLSSSGDSGEFEHRGCPASGDCRSPSDCEKVRAHPYPKVDYLGPDIDTGFRLGKHIHPGFMIVSMELAELLGRAPKHLQQVRGTIVGWEMLKGVWDGRPYPIIWITLPENLDVEYREFHPWTSSQEKFVKVWKSRRARTLRQIGKIRRIIERTRAQLPASLGVVKPYVVREGDEIPPEHELILKIVKSLYRGVGGEQDREGPLSTRGPSKPDNMIDELVEELSEHSRVNDEEILFRKFVL
ncbi:MAG: hypothetical protein V2B18_13790 [Pseudomonadota bacterium]